MNLNVKYQDAMGEWVEQSLTLHKNNKGYHVKIEGKYYFPKADNLVLKKPEEFKDKELWVLITYDNVSYGNISFAVPDFFVRDDEDSNKVYIEKEIPVNYLTREENIWEYGYKTIATLSSEEESDDFIDKLENAKVPESIIKEALSLFYDKLNNNQQKIKS